MGKSHHGTDAVASGSAVAVEVDSLAVQVDSVSLLEPLSFALDAGTAAAITGANGAGKTTLLRAVAGLIVPTSGSVRVGGLPADERSPAFRRLIAGHIGLASFARDLTLEEQLTMVAVSWGSEVDAARSAAEALLDKFGLLRLRTRFSHELSSGQTQMFSLALALARPFEVLLLDEPEQRLDKERRAQVAEILRAVVNDGKTLVFASHNTTLVDAVSDRAVAVTRS